MRFVDTLPPLLLTSSVVVLLAMIQTTFQVPFMTYMWVWRMTLEAIALLVLPIFVAAPTLRKPPFWLAALWGIAVGWIFSAILVGGPSHLNINWSGSTRFSGYCVLAGALYALLARTPPIRSMQQLRLVLRVGGLLTAAAGVLFVPVGYGISPKRDTSVFENLVDTGVFIKVAFVLTTLGLLALLISKCLPDGSSQ
jgi:hypothetical protein